MALRKAQFAPPAGLLERGEAKQIQDTVAEILARPKVDVQRFDLVKYNREHRDELARRAEVEQHRAANTVVHRVAGAHFVVGSAGQVAAKLLAAQEVMTGPAAHLLAGTVTGSTIALAWAVGGVVLRNRLGGWAPDYRRAGKTGTALGFLAAALPWAAWPVSAAALLAGAARCSSEWRAERSLTDRAGPTELPAPAPPLALEVVQDERAQVRDQVTAHVIGKGGPLAGAVLSRTDGEDGSYRFTLILSRQEYFRAVATADTRDRIARALLKPARQIELERHPDGEHLLILVIDTRDRLAAGVECPGPQYVGGAVPIGPFKDGEGWANWVLCDRQGARSGAIVGDPGSGKSTIAARVLLGARMSGCWRTLFADGDPGSGSSPVLVEEADWPAVDPGEILDQLSAMEAAYRARSAVIGTLTVDRDTGQLVDRKPGQRAAAKILPCPEWPGHLLMLDEARKLVNHPLLQRHGFVDRLETLVRDGRKYGLGVCYVTHSMLAADYGGGSILPNLLFAGNLFCCRIENPNEYASIDGIMVQPNTLPRGGGYAYNIQSGRLMMLRAAHKDDLLEGVTLPPRIPADEPTTLGMAPHWPSEERDPLAAYREAVQRATAWRAAAEARARGDQLQPPARERPESPGAPVTGIPELDGLQLPNVLRFPARAAEEPEPDGDLPTAAMIDERLNEADFLFLGAVYAGHLRSSEIMEATGLKGPRVSNIGKKLAGLGYVVDGGYSRWAIPTDEAAAR